MEEQRSDGGAEQDDGRGESEGPSATAGERSRPEALSSTGAGAAPDRAEHEGASVVGTDGASIPRSPASATGTDQLVEQVDRPRRRAFGREHIGIAVLVILALVCAGLVAAVVVKTQQDAALAAREAADYTPPPLSSSSAAAGPTVAVIGDESANRSASGVTASERWPALLGAALRSDVDVTASAGAGYVTEGSKGDTFVQLARDIPTDAGVVLFVGGAADASATPLEIAKAATTAFSAAANRAPDAVVVAVGPVYAPSDADASELQAMRTALRSSARIAGIRWVDPVGSGWLQGVEKTSDLSASAERSIASRMRSVVESPSP